MIKQSLHKQHLQLSNQLPTPTMHLNCILREQPRENLFQSYMKSRIAKMKNKNAQSKDFSVNLRVPCEQTQYIIRNKQCSMKNKVKKFITEIENLSTTKVVTRRRPILLRKQSEDWNDLDRWAVQEETIEKLR